MGIIRFLLAVWVCASHVGFSFPLLHFGAGAPAVAAFFVISGFYMGIILNAKYRSLDVFYVNRLLRLFPVYFIVFGITLSGLYTLPLTPHHLISWSEFKHGFAVSNLWGNLYLLFSNLFIGGMDLGFFQVIEPGTNQMSFTSHIGEGGLPVYQYFLVPQAWTLSLEVYFYLLAPFIVRRFYTIIIALCGSLLCWFIPYWLGLDFFYYFRFFPVTLSFFTAGAAIQWFYMKRITWVEQWRYLGIPALGIIVLASINYLTIPLDERLKMILFVALVTISIPFAFALTKQWRCDRFIGELSYPIYISHLAVSLLVLNIPFVADKPLFSMLGTIVVAIFIYLLIGKRIDVFRQKIALDYKKR